MSKRIALVAMLALGSALPVAPAHADQTAWQGTPTLIAGTSRYDAGEFVYNDFVYDDYGADTTPSGQPNIVSLAPTEGDFRYPSGLGNSADIVEVRARIAPNGEDLEVRVLLQTITDPAIPAVWVEVDGAPHVRTAENAVVDPATNTISFTLPGGATGDLLRLNIGAGLHDGYGGLRAGTTGTAHGNAGAFTTGGPTQARLFDLAFNTHAIEGRGGAWNEGMQADALQAGALAPFAQTIDLALLADNATTPIPHIEGYQVRLFASRQELGEGLGTSFPQFRGRWQPYAVWMPKSYEHGKPSPLFLNLHSLSVHHNQYRGGPPASASYKTLYEQYEAELGAIVVTPLARGPDGWYEDVALVDTLEVWADVLRTFTIDVDRVHVGGYSMGGYGTYRLTTMLPEAFASAVSVVGPPANGIWAYPAPPSGGEANPDNTRPQLENLRHIPIWITHGTFDELVPVAGVVHQADRFRELGYEHRFALHPAEDHLTFAYKDDWRREARWLAMHPRRVRDPHQVSFEVRPASWATNGNLVILGHLEALTAEIGARLDGAYWVGNVVPAGSGDVTAAVELQSGAIARRQVDEVAVSTVGADGPSPHVLTGTDVVWAEEAVVDGLIGTVRNVASLTIDVGRAGLSDQPSVAGVTADREVAVTFIRDGAVVGGATLPPGEVSITG